jgi:hypothetical protein
MMDCDSEIFDGLVNRWLVAGADCDKTPGCARLAVLANAYPGLQRFASFAAFRTIAGQQGAEAARALIDAIPIHLFSIED